MTMLADISPDIDETAIYGFCRRCDAETLVVKRDIGIGRDEAWGRPIIHVHWINCCGTCGDEL